MLLYNVTDDTIERVHHQWITHWLERILDGIDKCSAKGGHHILHGGGLGKHIIAYHNCLVVSI